MNETVMRFKNKLKIREYAAGYQLYDLRHGKSKGRVWKSSVFFFIAMAMLFILMMTGFNAAGYPVVTLMLMVCMYMCSYYVYMLPAIAKLKGEHIYKSSRLLSKEYFFEIKKDCFIMKNEHEYLKKYYSGLTDCIETDDIFMLAGGIDNTIIVISKRCLSGEENSELSAFFKREMVKQYRRARGRKKGKKT